MTIAHRLATVRRARLGDRARSRRDRRVQGTHDELMATSPAYARLFALPAAGSDDDLDEAVAV